MLLYCRQFSTLNTNVFHKQHSCLLVGTTAKDTMLRNDYGVTSVNTARSRVVRIRRVAA